ncbi:MAG TPA: carbohydrate ABC transporter permease [Chloroflexota bacterium]|nr:carbohydrate ABC transporter permease [Chloroflexota bacterium]
MTPAWPTVRPRAAARLRPALGTVVINGIALALGALFALPFYWLLSSSLKTTAQMFKMPPVWVPDPIVWSNYPRVFTESPFAQYTLNTLSIAVPVTVGTLLSCTMAAYGFSRLDWRGRDILFSVSLGVLMIPYIVTMVPTFILFRALGWIGTYNPLIVPAFFGNAYFIFLLRQFFRTIPLDLSDAARVDGASELDIFLRVVLPLARPALAVVALFSFIQAWGDFLQPLIYVSDFDRYTITLGLFRYLSDRVHNTDWGIMMAASTLTLLPIVVIFFFAQRTFIEGIKFTGMKG